MYAIVNIAGQQFRIEKGKKVFVHRLSGNVGDELSLGNVMLISDQDKVSIGEPYLSEALVLAKINAQVRGDKVQVFKKKRRKGYQKLNGHRQYFTELLIEDIAGDGKVTRPSEQPEKKAKKEPADPAVEGEAKKEGAAKPASAKKAPKATAAKAADKGKEAEGSKPAAKKASSKKDTEK